MNGWTRATKSNRCPICEHDSWCCMGERYVNCMRVQSAKPCDNGGWLHPIGDRPVARPVHREPERPTIDAAGIMRGLWRDTTMEMRQDAAKALGVSALALRLLGASWYAEKNAWAYPMFDGERHCIGIRLRDINGRKWAVTGSRQGIFWPKEQGADTAWIVEGPTDTAAALTLGLTVIGRPSCLGCAVYTNLAIHRLGCRRAVIVSDNDGPGVNGAAQLASSLQVPCCSVVPPCKDMREFVRLGGTRDLLDSLISQSVWTQ